MTNLLCRFFGHRFKDVGGEVVVCVRCWVHWSQIRQGLRDMPVAHVQPEPDRYVVAGTDGRIYDSVTNTWTAPTQGNDTAMVKVSGSQG